MEQTRSTYEPATVKPGARPTGLLLELELEPCDDAPAMDDLLPRDELEGDELDDCGCVFHPECSGLGTIYCDPPCGGDQCICLCGGERECPGCDSCGAGIVCNEDGDS
jgi:hypothetical protein